MDIERVQRVLENRETAADRAWVRADGPARRAVVQHARMEMALRTLLAPQGLLERRAAAIISDVQGDNRADAILHLEQALHPTPRSFPWWALGIAAAAAAVAWMFWPASALPRVATGDVLVLNDGQTGRYELPDGSRFTLEGPADMIVGRTVRLRQGHLAVEAAHHEASEPLIIMTPHGRVEVVGTKFVMDARRSGTRLAVREGEVKFYANGEPATVRVHAGQNAVGGRYERDPIFQPFSSDSPWNTAIGSKAQFASPDIPGLKSGGDIETREWAVPIYVARSSDPIQNLIYRSIREVAGRVRVDPSIPPAGRSDSFLALVDEQLGAAWELYSESRLPNGDYLASDIGQTDLRGSGWAVSGPSHSGASMLGGLIRKGELRWGIPHALALRVRADLVNRNGGPFEWPAHRALTSWDQYGTNGNIRLGTLLAIPPGEDVYLLGLEDAGLQVARALQDYGAYIVGTFVGGGKPITFVAERACADDVSPLLISELGRIAPLLRKVVNNTPGSPGGGGNPRQPAPADLVEIP